jgi:hypothetical protein
LWYDMKAVLTFALSVILFVVVVRSAEAKQQQQNLSAVVMITITTPAWQHEADASAEALPIPNDDYRPIARAEGNLAADWLGTLVAGGDNTMITTTIIGATWMRPSVPSHFAPLTAPGMRKSTFIISGS